MYSCSVCFVFVDVYTLVRVHMCVYTRRKFETGIFMFGNPVDFQLGLDNGQWWTAVDGSTMWALAVTSIGARSLNLLFDMFRLPENSELYVRSLTTGEMLGPFTSQNNKDHGHFSTYPLVGDSLAIEYYADKSVLHSPEIRIRTVVHGYKDLSLASNRFMVMGRSGKCNINVACKDGQDWSAQVRSTVMFMNRFGSGFCSGIHEIYLFFVTNFRVNGK